MILRKWELAGYLFNLRIADERASSAYDIKRITAMAVLAS